MNQQHNEQAKNLPTIPEAQRKAMNDSLAARLTARREVDAQVQRMSQCEQVPA